MVDRAMDNPFMAMQDLPFTAYETEFIWGGEDAAVLLRVDIHPVTITRYGISPGCSTPSVDVRYRDGSKALSSADMFFASIEDAQADAADAMAEAKASPPYYVLQQRLAVALDALVEIQECYLGSEVEDYKRCASEALNQINNITGV